MAYAPCTTAGLRKAPGSAPPFTWKARILSWDLSALQPMIPTAHRAGLSHLCTATGRPDPTRVPYQNPKTETPTPALTLNPLSLGPSFPHCGTAATAPGSAGSDAAAAGSSRRGRGAVVPSPAPHIDVAGVSLTGYAPGYKDRNQDSALLLDTFLSNRQQVGRCRARYGGPTAWINDLRGGGGGRLAVGPVR
jgi:hypothetical protein